MYVYLMIYKFSYNMFIFGALAYPFIVCVVLVCLFFCDDHHLMVGADVGAVVDDAAADEHVTDGSVVAQ